MSEKTTAHVDTPLGPSTQRALDAVRDLHAAGPIAALDREGYIARTRNDGRSDRVLSLTDRGRRALEIANAG